MPKIYWMSGFNIREEKHKEYKSFLNSKRFRKVCAEIEKETGMKHLETYFTIIPSSSEEGDYDAYDFWELPNHAAMDKLRNSAALARLAEASYEFTEPRPSKSVVLRKASDTKVVFEPKKK